MFLYSFKIVIFSILTFLSIFSIINLVNTVLTNAVVRKGEVKKMQVTGMTWIQLKSLLLWEGCLIVGKSLVIMTIIGVILGKLVCYFLQNNGFPFIVYSFPLIPILISFIVGFAVVIFAEGVFALKLVVDSPTSK